MADRYRPAGTNKEFLAIMAKAWATNRSRDKMDRECGVPPPSACGPAVYLSAAITAIETGIKVKAWDKVEAWDSVAEGLAMLEDLRDRYAIVLGRKKAAPQEASV